MTTESGNPALAYARHRLPKGRRVRPDSRDRWFAPESAGYYVKNLANFKISKFAAPDNLYCAFKLLEEDGGHGAGTDGFRPEHFSDNELRPILREVSGSLIDGTYQPYEPRICTVSKNAGGTRDLALFRFMDRTVAKALLNCLKPFWNERLIALSTRQIFARLHWAIQEQRHYVLATDDIRKCFDYAPLDDVMAWHRHYIQKQRLLELIERIIRGNDSLDTGIGLAQGSPISPTAMDLLLHHVLDLVMTHRTRNTSSFRYVDNLAYLCSNVSEGIRVLSMANEVLEEAGFQLKREEGEPQDLRAPEYNKVLLGLIPLWQNGLLTFSIPESSFETLNTGLAVANEAPIPAENALRRCTGWLQAQGPALMRNVEREVVDRVVDMARHAGFRNVTHRDMLDVAALARSSWHRELEEAR